MPPRKPPKKLSTRCTTVISNTILDVIVQVEQSMVESCNNLTRTSSSEQNNCDNATKENDQLQKYYEKEFDIAKYLLSSIPNALISLVILDIIKEFSCRWSEIIQLSEKHSSISRNNFYMNGSYNFSGESANEFTHNNIDTFSSTTANSSWSLLNNILWKTKESSNLKLPPTLKTLLRVLFVSYPANKSDEMITNCQPNSSGNITQIDFSSLMKIGPVTESYFSEFNTGLSLCLNNHSTITHLTLACRHSKNSLPQCTDEHLEIIGRNCHLLIHLDISFIRGLTGDGIKYLIPNNVMTKKLTSENDTKSAITFGCPILSTLYIFDCGFFDKDVAEVASCLPNLEYLGYKETGKVIKHLYKNILAKAHATSYIESQNESNCDQDINQKLKDKPLGLKSRGLKKLTHLNNLGSKARRLIASGLRFKKPLIEAALNVCPNIQHVKVRVTDNDVENMSVLCHLKTVEFMFNVGTIHSPGFGTASFLQIRGANLTSVAFICSSVSLTTLKVVGENCPNLTEFWCRSNFFTLISSGYENTNEENMIPPPEFTIDHKYFQKLKTLYFRVGEGELSIVYLPFYVLYYILRNAGQLTELIIAVRSSTVNHKNLTTLLQKCELSNLEKLLVVVPGMNSLPNILNLTMETVYFIINYCTSLKKLGNLLSWTLENEKHLLDDFQKEILETNFELEVLNKKMLMR